jgi:hypothetical protein
MVVDFVVRGLDDHGRPSAAMLQVAEVAVVDAQGQVLKRFRDAEALARFVQAVRGSVRLLATETVGMPRTDLVGRYVCYKQAFPDTLVGEERP